MGDINQNIKKPEKKKLMELYDVSSINRKINIGI